MPFEADAFISYAHLDNVELVEGRKGWVANLHRALEVRVGQLLGKSPQIWRDPKLTGNDPFEETLIERLAHVAVLVAIVSPRYLKSEWTMRELNEFCSAAASQSGIRVGDKTRVFKVLKTPVALDRTPGELRGLLGYEFFKVDPDTGKVRELDEIFGAEAQRDFWIKLDDLAHDICYLLEALDGNVPAPVSIEAAAGTATAPSGTGTGTAAVTDTVYLAETTSDLREQREALRRDLLQHGYAVLPDRSLPHVAEEVEVAVRQDLERCRMSIHLIGKHYGLVPEGSLSSLIEMQHELATAHQAAAPLARLLWMPDGLDVRDERQQKLIERVRLDPRIAEGADLLETYFEDLRLMMHDWLERARTPAPAPAAAEAAAGTAAATASSAPPSLYVVADQRDLETIDPWVDALFAEGLETIRPFFDGDEAEIREYHEENLASCDGVLIVYGAGNELWVRRKLRELQKAAGYGRTKPRPAVAVCLLGPRTPAKEQFRTHEATVVAQWDGCAMAPLRPFIAQLKAGSSV